MFVLDLSERLTDFADVAIRRVVAIVCLIAVALILRWVLHRLVDRLIQRAAGGVLPERLADRFADRLSTSARRVQRTKTMGGMLKSVVTGIIFVIFGTMTLGELGINIAPIIASAGIIGLALGFGAQSLVKDYLSGICMIFEDQYGVGDVVNVGAASGTVEAVSLRVTRLRALDGTVWYVPNGEILSVGNMSQNWSRAVIDVGIAYGEDIARAKRILQEVAHDLWADDDFKNVVIEEPEVTGVEALAPDSVTLRVLVKTQPLEQWGVARELRQRIKTRFDHEGIEIPFQQRVVWHREEKREEKKAAEAATATSDTPTSDAG
ncbi:mechanosensitive ion channel family protein [Nocardioides sp. KR10-350]|uniref:mechanosensitive ion channel family protein n=1 Tax=Nocardioides cheoyonin TaxID=3156615 RepID=UPI0032B3A6C8